jgi:hypothetical protein
VVVGKSKGQRSDEGLDEWWELTRQALTAKNERTLEQLSARTGHTPENLRSYANVALWIDDEERLVLRAWRDVNGRALDRWHITYLSRKTLAVRAKCLRDMRDGIWPAVNIRLGGRAKIVGRPNASHVLARTRARASTAEPGGAYGASCVEAGNETARVCKRPQEALTNVPGFGSWLTEPEITGAAHNAWQRVGTAALKGASVTRDRKPTDEAPFLELGDEVPRPGSSGKTSPESEEVPPGRSGPQERGAASGSEEPRLLRWRLTGEALPWDLTFRIEVRQPMDPSAKSEDGSR